MDGSSTALVPTRKHGRLVYPKTKERDPNHQSRHSSATRRKVIEGLKITFGNVTLACAHAGINPDTYYRWMKSPSKLNRRFQAKVATVKGVIEETRVDLFEAAHLNIVRDPKAQGHANAVQFGLERKGASRGWSDKKSEPVVAALPGETSIDVKGLRETIANRAVEKGVPFTDEVNNFLVRFGSKLPESVQEELRAGKEA